MLTVTEMLRKKGVVGKFVEFYGPGLASLPLADRATIGNMSPEYGATCAIFPVDDETLRYLRFTGRPEERVALVEAYMKEQGLFHTADSPGAAYSATRSSWTSRTVEPSIAGPRRPQDRVPLASAREALPDGAALAAARSGRPGGDKGAARTARPDPAPWACGARARRIAVGAAASEPPSAADQSTTARW